MSPTTRVRFFDLSVDVFTSVGGPGAVPVGFGQGEDAEAFGQVLFGPCRELGLSLPVGVDEVFEALFGVGLIVSVEDGFDVGGDLAFEVLFGDVVLRVLLEMKFGSVARGWR